VIVIFVVDQRARREVYEMPQPGELVARDVADTGNQIRDVARRGDLVCKILGVLDAVFAGIATEADEASEAASDADDRNKDGG
jgi:hypothetical protein